MRSTSWARMASMPDGLEVGDGGAQAHGLGDGRRARPRTSGAGTWAVKPVGADVEDHAAPAEERRHLLEQLAPAPTAPRCRWGRASCGPRRPGSRRRARPTSIGRWGTDWAPSASTSGAGGVGRLGDLGEGGDGAEHVGHGRARRRASPRRGAGRGRTGRAGSRRRRQIHRSSTPRSSASISHGTMLAWCSISVSSTTSPARQVGPAPGGGDQVERLGGVLGEDHLVLGVGGADEAAHRDPGRLVEAVGLLGDGVDAAVHVGVGRLVVVRPWPRAPRGAAAAVAAESR